MKANALGRFSDGISSFAGLSTFHHIVSDILLDNRTVLLLPAGSSMQEHSGIGSNEHCQRNRPQECRSTWLPNQVDLRYRGLLRGQCSLESIPECYLTIRRVPSCGATFHRSFAFETFSPRHEFEPFFLCSFCETWLSVEFGDYRWSAPRALLMVYRVAAEVTCGLSGSKAARVAARPSTIGSAASNPSKLWSNWWQRVFMSQWTTWQAFEELAALSCTILFGTL